MNYYGIASVAEKLGIHESSLRRWEEWEYIFPERVSMGKSTIRIYSEDDLTILQRAKQLMDGNMELRAAFEEAYSDFIKQEDNTNETK